VNVLLIVLAWIIALIFAANIGASGTAATMGAAYGGGAINNRRIAVVLVAIFAILGANLGGGEVVRTMSKALIPSDIVTLQITVIILFSATVTLYFANRIGIPLSTSEVTVGSIVGVGLAVNSVHWKMLGVVILTWVALPFLAFFIAFLLGRFFRPIEQRLHSKHPRAFSKLLTAALIITGCYEAFAAGMNNVANAIGPLVGSGTVSPALAILIGSVFLGMGAIFLGGKVLETNGKKITSLSLLQGTLVSSTSGTLVIIASLFGIPVPLTQATTMAIIGIGTEKCGRLILKNPVVIRIFRVWVASPIFSLLLSMLLVKVIIQGASAYMMPLVIFFIFILYNYHLKQKRLPGQDRI
jgi:sulfate permease